MAITVKLGKKPKNFPKKVTFQMLDPDTGATVEGKITWTFKYRTRTEFGQMLDELVTAAKGAKPNVGEEELILLAKQFTQTAEANADYMLKIAEGWDLVDEDFTRANLIRLADEVPGALSAAMDIYSSAIRDGRLGN